MIRPSRMSVPVPWQCLCAGLLLGLALLFQTPAATAQSASQEFTITVTDQGFEPASIDLKKDVPTRLTFVRTSEKSCATDVVVPSLKVRRELPLNARVSLQFTPKDTGDIGFTCGQQMFKGTLVVQ